MQFREILRTLPTEEGLSRGSHSRILVPAFTEFGRGLVLYGDDLSKVRLPQDVV